MPIIRNPTVFSTQLSLDSLDGIAAKDIDSVWPSVEGLITEALSTSYTTPAKMHELLNANAAQLWLAKNGTEIDAVCITQVAVHDLGKTCGIWVCVGTNRAAWQDYMTVIEAWAKSNGCIGMMHTARLGWQRILKPMGYAPTHIVLEKRF